jgi:nucleosome assembly protein 1-like 1
MEAFSGNPQLLHMLQGRLGSLVGKPSGYIDSLPKDVKRRVNGLKYFQSKHAELEAKFQEEILVLEKKYAQLYKPLYEKRAAIVTGLNEPTDEEVAAGEQIDVDEEAETESEETKVDANDNDEKAVTGVPEFWLTALRNHPQLVEFITDKDESALKHLVDVRMSYIEKPGFKLEFEFSENAYFTNKVLTKTYFYQDQAGYGGDFVYDHAEGTEIIWKKDKDLTVTVETKKQRHKGTNKVREVKRTVPAETFFTFFNPPQVPADGEELDEEEAEGLDAKLEADYELGEEFKEKIIPHAVDWFTGKALQFEDLNDENDYYDEDEDEDEDDDDDEEEEDDDDDVGAVTH